MKLYHCLERACRGHEDPIDALLNGQRGINSKMEKVMGVLENLQAADLAEENELTTFLTDIAGKLDGHDDPAIQAVADDITARVARMQDTDPGAPSASDPTPTDGTGDDGAATPPDAGDGSTPPADGGDPAPTE